MASFTASLRDTLGETSINLDPTSTIFTIVDESNYALSSEVGHLEADFSLYRELIVSTQSGATVTLTSLTTGTPTSIPTPDSGNNVFTLDVFDEDGVYKFELVTVPTWDGNNTYEASESDHVYYDGVIYKAVVDITVVHNSPDTEPTLFQPVSREELPLKYRAIERVAHICNLVSCKEDYVADALCTMDNFICSDDVLCESHEFMNATKLLILHEAIKCGVGASDWNSVEHAVRLSKKICKCDC
jgi:hypothetical protein